MLNSVFFAQSWNIPRRMCRKSVFFYRSTMLAPCDVCCLCFCCLLSEMSVDKNNNFGIATPCSPVCATPHLQFQHMMSSISWNGLSGGYIYRNVTGIPRKRCYVLLRLSSRGGDQALWNCNQGPPARWHAPQALSLTVTGTACCEGTSFQRIGVFRPSVHAWMFFETIPSHFIWRVKCPVSPPRETTRDDFSSKPVLNPEIRNSMTQGASTGKRFKKTWEVSFAFDAMHVFWHSVDIEVTFTKRQFANGDFIWGVLLLSDMLKKQPNKPWRQRFDHLWKEVKDTNELPQFLWSQCVELCRNVNLCVSWLSFLGNNQARELMQLQHHTRLHLASFLACEDFPTEIKDWKTPITACQLSAMHAHFSAKNEKGWSQAVHAWWSAHCFKQMTTWYSLPEWLLQDLKLCEGFFCSCFSSLQELMKQSEGHRALSNGIYHFALDSLLKMSYRGGLWAGAFRLRLVWVLGPAVSNLKDKRTASRFVGVCQFISWLDVNMEFLSGLFSHNLDTMTMMYWFCEVLLNLIGCHDDGNVWCSPEALSPPSKSYEVQTTCFSSPDNSQFLNFCKGRTLQFQKLYFDKPSN